MFSYEKEIEKLRKEIDLLRKHAKKNEKKLHNYKLVVNTVADQVEKNKIKINSRHISFSAIGSRLTVVESSVHEALNNIASFKSDLGVSSNIIDHFNTQVSTINGLIKKFKKEGRDSEEKKS